MGRRARVRRHRLEEEREEQEPEALAEPKATAPPTLADRTLDLQKTAGNRATGAAIQRWTGLWLQQAAKWPKTPQLRIGSHTIPLASYSETASHTGTTTGVAGGRSGEGELSLAVTERESATDLHRAALTGAFEKAELLQPSKDGSGGLRFILTDVTLFDLTMSAGGSANEAFTVRLRYKKRELSQTPR